MPSGLITNREKTSDNSPGVETSTEGPIIKMSDNSPAVIAFKREREQQRQDTKKKIKDYLEENFTVIQLPGSEQGSKPEDIKKQTINDFMKQLYPYGGKNEFIPAKKYLSPKGTSDLLSLQQEALDFETDEKEGLLWPAVFNFCKEQKEHNECITILANLKSKSPKHPSVLKFEKVLLAAGANKKLIADMKDLEKKLENSTTSTDVTPANNNYITDVNPNSKKYSAYVSALNGLFWRQTKLKFKDNKNIDDLAKYISQNENAFKAKFKNSYVFNNAIEPRLKTLNACKNIDDVKEFFNETIGIVQPSEKKSKNSTTSTDVTPANNNYITDVNPNSKKYSNYVSALNDLFWRQTKLKFKNNKNIDDLAKYISQNENAFKAKFKNSYVFNNAIEPRLKTLNACKNIDDVKEFFNEAIGIMQPSAKKSKNSTTSTDVTGVTPNSKKHSRYVSALNDLFWRQTKLKFKDNKNIDDLAKYISQNEKAFKAKFKNSYVFNNEIAPRLKTLNTCKNIDDVKEFFKNTFGIE